MPLLNGDEACQGFTAMTDISTFTSNGKRDTWTVSLAGNWPLKKDP
jgi:hypothetical protein